VDGTKFDFIARFSDGEVGVEATSPLFDRRLGENAKYYAPLIKMIERMIPPGWFVLPGRRVNP